MINKICARANCSKEFITDYKTKLYCSSSCMRSAQQQRSVIRLHDKILNAFNNKCKKCGFDDVRALQIDHVNGGGVKELGYKNRISRMPYYRKILREISSGKYQLLCANCNLIKRHTHNEK